MAKYLVEFVGTFFLLLAIGLNVAPGASVPLGGALAPLAIGLTLMVMVYAGGHMSGAHYNPAVTVAVFLRGRCKASDVVPYILSQLLGGVGGSVLALYLIPPALAQPVVIDTVRVFLAEFVFTFALAYVVLNVATSKATAGNSYYGLAIGATVMSGAFAVGSISGAAFNPAVVLGVVIMGLANPANIWVYLVANFLGSVVAALVFRTLNQDDL